MCHFATCPLATFHSVLVTLCFSCISTTMGGLTQICVPSFWLAAAGCNPHPMPGDAARPGAAPRQRGEQAVRDPDAHARFGPAPYARGRHAHVRRARAPCAHGRCAHVPYAHARHARAHAAPARCAPLATYPGSRGRGAEGTGGRGAQQAPPIRPTYVGHSTVGAGDAAPGCSVPEGRAGEDKAGEGRAVGHAGNAARCAGGGHLHGEARHEDQRAASAGGGAERGADGVGHGARVADETGATAGVHSLGAKRASVRLHSVEAAPGTHAEGVADTAEGVQDGVDAGHMLQAEPASSAGPEGIQGAGEQHGRSWAGSVAGGVAEGKGGDGTPAPGEEGPAVGAGGNRMTEETSAEQGARTGTATFGSRPATSAAQPLHSQGGHWQREADGSGAPQGEVPRRGDAWRRRAARTPCT